MRFVAGGAELRQRRGRAVAALAHLPRAQQRAHRAGPSEISADLLAGSRDTILAEFYERALADQPAGVRQVHRGRAAHRVRLPREPRRGARAEGLRRGRRARPTRWPRSSTGGCCASRSGSTCAASSSRTTCCAAWSRRAATCASSARRATRPRSKLAAQRERELAATRKALVRARQIAAVCARARRRRGRQRRLRLCRA